MEVEDFCRAEYPKLVGALSLYLSDRHSAEDVAQEALARVYRDWHKVGKFESPTGWLYRVAFNLAKSQLRRRLIQRQTLRRASDLRADAEEVPEEASLLRMTMHAAVDELPRRQREAVVCRYYLELSVDEAARLMDCPASTVKTLTRRGLAALRKAWISNSRKENLDVL